MFSLMLDWWVPGWERYRVTRLLSEESEEKRQPLPTVLCMQIRCDIKCRVRDILPARHSLSDRRINSSHGNSFIFQGHRVPFFQVGCRRSVVERRGGEKDISPAKSVFPSSRLAVEERAHREMSIADISSGLTQASFQGSLGSKMAPT